MWLFVMGRQPALSLAELESVFDFNHILSINKQLTIIEKDQIPKIEKFGSIIKIGKIIGQFSSESELIKAMIDGLPDYSKKINLGLSWYANVSANFVGAKALQIKKQAKLINKKIRVIPNNSNTLSSAQVYHNKLDQPEHCEYLVTQHNSRFLLAKTHEVQNIEAYSRRDFDRPARDARVGMLPPKLAQIMLNLAQAKSTDTVLDPFCGTGVVLQEALLLGLKVYGSDISTRMIQMTKQNLSWLSLQYPHINTSDIRLEVADAKINKWITPYNIIVSELYLGPPLTSIPSENLLKTIISDVNKLLIDTLKNLAQQTHKDQYLVLAIPAWTVAKNKTFYLPAVDQIGNLGYNLVSFKLAKHSELVYFREGQFVKRQLLVIKRK